MLNIRIAPVDTEELRSGNQPGEFLKGPANDAGGVESHAQFEDAQTHFRAGIHKVRITLEALIVILRTKSDLRQLPAVGAAGKSLLSTLKGIMVDIFQHFPQGGQAFPGVLAAALGAGQHVIIPLVFKHPFHGEAGAHELTVRIGGHHKEILALQQ